MLLDIRACLKGVNMPLNITKTLDCGSFDFKNFSVPKPMEYTLEAFLESGQLVLCLYVKGEILASCARCLNDAVEEFSLEERYEISEADLENPDFELVFNNALKLDIDETAMQELILKLPQIYFCNEDCGGLCQVCGNRASECDCEEQESTQEMDPRWQVLKDLL